MAAGGAAHLAGLTNMTSLNVDNTQLTDAGLAHLKELTRLQLLGFFGTKVTDGGLKHLKALPQLRTLILNRTHVADVDLGAIHFGFNRDPALRNRGGGADYCRARPEGSRSHV